MPAPPCGTPPVFCKSSFSKWPIHQCVNCNEHACEDCLDKGGCYHCRDELSKPLTFCFINRNGQKYRLACENGTPSYKMKITVDLLNKKSSNVRLSSSIVLSVRCRRIRSCHVIHALFPSIIIMVSVIPDIFPS